MAVLYSQNGTVVYKHNIRYDEPEFKFGYSGTVRGNFPPLPSGYTQVNAIKLNNLSDSISLGVIPKSSDSDLYIYIGFNVKSVVTNYSCILGTTYVDEQHSITRIITKNLYTDAFYTNMFTVAGGGSSEFNSMGKPIIHVLMRKDGVNRFYYNGLDRPATNYGELLQEDPTELNLMVTLNLNVDIYGLFIRQNGVVYHNWVPCRRNSDNKAGFYNAVTGSFITQNGMSVVNS
jgi:hypothetical protein